MTPELDKQIQATDSQQAEDLKAALAKNNNNIKKLEDCIKKLVGMLQASKTAHGTAATKCQEVANKIKELEKKLAAKDTQDQEQLTAARARVAELEAEMKALGDKHAAELDALRAELTALKAKAGDITKLTAEHTAAIKKLNDEHAAKLGALESEHEVAIKKLQSLQKECEKEKVALQDELDELKRQGENKKTEVASDKARIDAYETMIKSLIDSLNQERDDPCAQSEELLNDFNKALRENNSIFARLTGS
jgi:chromosome segregation ATPase